ncbi:O-methyltransferase, family 3 [Ostreococcus tauri]|uniref:O-methyltransferase, family 3 n=1 Tax=Ostreococcus tauri TaxID=70448 RepID=A0A090M6B1_OSTTA|nr:O-methyltransferase, family 3 [Ostreococcus tauri]CEF97659.1 O-methyltransferase, family 3 [Ostreococcus tauri]|eukprot:XP_022838814.1 O-methyltransferase, family 3 [Ostreococcus tauri]
MRASSVARGALGRCARTIARADGGASRARASRRPSVRSGGGVGRRRAVGASSSSERASTGPWNTAPLALHEGLYTYLLRRTREAEVLRALREETSALRGARMQVAPEQGALLALCVELMDARRVIEIGTYTGYSSIAMALAMRPGGTLYACDRDEDALRVARRYWSRAGVDDVVKEKYGDAKESVRELLETYGENSFDMGFIDADKRAYREYYESLLRLVRPGGLIVVDNVLWYGKVADATVTDKQTEAIRAFNDFVATDERVTYTLLPVGDGLSLCRKR